MAGAASGASGQVVYDPNNGFLVQRLLQAAPVVGSTSTFPPFPNTGLGFAGAPSSYAGIGLSNLVAPVLPPLSPGDLGAVAGAAPGPLPQTQMAPSIVAPAGARLVPGAVAAARPPPIPLSALIGENPLLPSLQPGATPIQAGDDRAPWLLVNPSIRVSQGFDDNPRQTARRFADSVTELNPGLIVSADGPRLKALVSSTLDYEKYARAGDQDKFTVNGTGYGQFAVLPEHLVVDGRAAIVQVSTAGGVGFGNPALIPADQQNSLLTTSVTPILRQSIGPVDADLRYNHSSVSPLSQLSGAASAAAGNAVAATETNEGTLTMALGRGAGILAARVILDATDIASQSTAASTQFRGYGDIQYRLNREIALTGRIGYEDIRYPLARLVFIGPVGVVGTRLDVTPDSAIVLRYGRQDGTTGFNGAATQELGPRTLLQVSVQTGVNSRQEQIAANLNASRLDIYGNVVDADAGLPLALTNPEFAYSNAGVFRTQQARVGVSHEFETDSVRLFVFYERMTALAPPATSDIARGAEIGWFRSMTPRLSGAISLGYATHGTGSTLTSSLVLTYDLQEGVQGTLNYQFQSLDSTGPNPSYLRNVVSAGVRASF